MSEIGEILAAAALIFILITAFVSIMPNMINQDQFNLISNQEETKTVSDPWSSSTSFQENTTVLNGSLTLKENADKGIWISDRINLFERPIEHQQLKYRTDLRGGHVNLTFRYSDFLDFDEENKYSRELVDGFESIDLQNLQEARYVRIEMRLSK